jgi:hypothetical protein
LPSMVKDVFAFLGWLVIKHGFEWYGLALSVLYGYLLDTTAGT